MCTAISLHHKDTYFGRNLDLERGHGEQVVITPRNYPFSFRLAAPIPCHYAMIGMAVVTEELPLYFEATNEKGLSMAGLNFPQNAVYFPPASGKDNVAPFEFIPWVLSQCATVAEAKTQLRNTRLVNVNFSESLPLSPLHWMISDREQSIVAESTADGLTVWDDPFEVLTNNPPFSYHLTNMSNYMSLHAGPSVSRFDTALPLNNYSLGMGALGLPGDFSSASRFVRAFFVKENTTAGNSERECVNQFFHILQSVAMPKGCVWTPNGFEYTRYSSCCNADAGIYYYTTYDDFTIRSVDLRQADLNGSALVTGSTDKI